MEEFNDETRCIETPRLLLRKHALQDYPLFYRMLTDPLGKRFTGGVTHLSYEERLKLYRRDIALPFSTKEGEFAVIGKDKGEYLGYCGYHWNDALRSSELFYGLRREHWGHGYGREAASAFLACFFAATDFERLAAVVEPENEPSIKLLRHLGFEDCDAADPAFPQGRVYLLTRGGALRT